MQLRLIGGKYPLTNYGPYWGSLSFLMQIIAQYILKPTIAEHALHKATRKDIVNQSTNQFAVVGVIWDPGIVLSGIHAIFEVCFTQAPPLRPVILQGANDGVDQFAF